MHAEECASTEVVRDGIGHYEFWGQRCFDMGDHQLQLCSCQPCELDVSSDRGWLLTDGERTDDPGHEYLLDALKDFLPSKATVYDEERSLELQLDVTYKIVERDGGVLLVAEYGD